MQAHKRPQLTKENKLMESKQFFTTGWLPVGVADLKKAKAGDKFRMLVAGYAPVVIVKTDNGTFKQESADDKKHLFSGKVITNPLMPSNSRIALTLLEKLQALQAYYTAYVSATADEQQKALEQDYEVKRTAGYGLIKLSDIETAKKLFTVIAKDYRDNFLVESKIAPSHLHSYIKTGVDGKDYRLYWYPRALAELVDAVIFVASDSTLSAEEFTIE